MAPIKTLIPEPTLKQECDLHIGKIRGVYWVRSSSGRRGFVLVNVKTPVARQIANSAVSLGCDTCTAQSNSKHVRFPRRIRRYACCVWILQR
jgi:hypothetical protein